MEVPECAVDTNRSGENKVVYAVPLREATRAKSSYKVHDADGDQNMFGQ